MNEGFLIVLVRGGVPYIKLTEESRVIFRIRK